MREKLLMKILLNQKKPIGKQCLCEILRISESTLRNQVSTLNRDGYRYDFEIIMLKGQGYYLSVKDKHKFEKYLDKLNYYVTDNLSASERLDMIMFIILQKQSFFTFDQIAEEVSVSKSTIVRDFKAIEEKLKKYDLQLEKTHFGERVIGEELGFRKAFTDYVLYNPLFTKPTREFYEFNQGINIEEISCMLNTVLNNENIIVSGVIFDNIVGHLIVLMYRVLGKNFVNSDSEASQINSKFINVSKKIIKWVEKNMTFRYQLQK